MREIVQAITPGQLEQVAKLFREYRAELPSEFCFSAFDEEIAGLPGAYASPRGKLELAMVAGEPAGCVGLRPFPLKDDTCEMKRLYVRKAFRGMRLGEELTQRALEGARNLGYSRLRLDTYPQTMQAAVQIYRKFGFKDVAPDPSERIEGLLYMEISLR